MLPPPTLSFTIPSIHDDTVLDCRIYHPSTLATEWEKKSAIVAHPYAPLGGSYDDPVVDIVGSVLLGQSFVLGTFNFRGAGNSKGKTSWMGKPERNDYISFVGFMIYYLHYLDPLISSENEPDEFRPMLATIPSRVLPPAEIQSPRDGHPSSSRSSDRKNKEPQTEGLLLLGGYSYGSLITTQLPNTADILSIFSKPDVGTAASEIRLRAEHLAKQQNEILAAVISPPISGHRGRHSLQIDDRLAVSHPHSPGLRIGGEETNPSIRRSSHESKRSLDSGRLRRSLDKVRSMSHHASPVRHSSYSSQNSENPPSPKKMGKRKERSSEEHMRKNSVLAELSKQKIVPAQMEAVELMPLKTAYLLISPLQGIVKELATMAVLRPFIAPKPKPPSSSSGGGHEIHKLAQTDTLAIFGTSDTFTSAKKLRTWATKLENLDGSKFRWREVDGAGHFWHGFEYIEVLRDEVGAFVRDL